LHMNSYVVFCLWKMKSLTFKLYWKNTKISLNILGWHLCTDK
jgi:hypothetical protein